MIMENLSHNSERFLELVQLAVDGALHADDERVFFQRINTCPRCLDTYYKEKGYKQFINNKLADCRKSPNNDLLSRIKSNLNSDPASA